MADGVLHYARSNGPFAGCDAAGPVLLGKEEQEGDGVPGNISEIGSDVGSGTKTFPDVPGCRGRIAKMRRLAGMEHCRGSAPIAAESIAGSRVSNVHKVSWGLVEEK
jgi:hypothetical protein